MSDAPNGNGDKLKALADSVWAMVIARYVVPLLATAAIAMGGYILHGLSGAIDEAKATALSATSSAAVEIAKVAETTNATHEAVSTLNAKLDASLIGVQGTLQNHENRIEKLETTH